MAQVDPLAVQATFIRGGEWAGAFLPAVRRPERPEISMGGFHMISIGFLDFRRISAGFWLGF